MVSAADKLMVKQIGVRTGFRTSDKVVIIGQSLATRCVYHASLDVQLKVLDSDSAAQLSRFVAAP